jgi:hypothetical protein
MTEVIGEYVEFIYCCCKCGFTRSKYNSQGREVKYINGHFFRGKKQSAEQIRKLTIVRKRYKVSEETKEKLSQALKGKLVGENNGMFGRKRELSPTWKGKDVSIDGLHKRIRIIFPQSEHPICMLCKINPSEDLACITGIYDDNLKNWAYFCRKCHLYYDNLIERNLLIKGKDTRFKKKDAK